MKITENEKAVDELIARLQERNAKEDARRNGTIHTSDLVLCVRQSAFKRIVPKPPSLEELGYYVDGNTSDRALKNLFKPSASMQVDGVWLTPDAEDENGVLQEFKATRSNDGLSAHFGRQLAYYLAQTGKSYGRLIVRRLTRKYPKKGEPDTWKPFDVYDVHIEPQEMLDLRTEIRGKKEALAVAIEQQNPLLAPGVKHDAESNWRCKRCQWKQECFAFNE